MFWIGFDKNLAKMFRALTLKPGIVPRTIHVLPHPLVLTALYFGLTLSIIVPVVLYCELCLADEERKLRQSC